MIFRRPKSNNRRSKKLCFDTLEKRMLLAATITHDYTAPLPLAEWFRSFDDVPRLAANELNQVDKIDIQSLVGPHDLATGEWVVQLTEQATRRVTSVEGVGDLIKSDLVDAKIISGLGSPGLVLVRARGESLEAIEAFFSENASIGFYSRNSVIQGQSVSPNDPDFISGQLGGLDSLGITDAWDKTRGSMSTVVGIIDSGIDPSHEDLYLNIWLNQGEIPASFRDQLVDIDNDGLITFYDLNHLIRSEEAPYALTETSVDNRPNSAFVRDLNGNGRIDADDLLRDPNWADGRDSDQNGFIDDLFGVNFRSNAFDRLASNNPSDSLGHGTHVAGIIGAIGNNDIGGAGVNWQTSLMSLRILDNNNQGDTGAAIRAINYATMMRERYQGNANGQVAEGANVRVLNNSWGQPGGYEAALATAISDSGDAGILFVAATGNGNILGQGVDNDQSPFYPANYESPNVISVAASFANGFLAPFSNFGENTVDIAAPGVGIRSTMPDGGYAAFNGTSFSAPFVSGTAALIASLVPDPTVSEIRQAILNNATTLPGLVGEVAQARHLSPVGALNAKEFSPSARLAAAPLNVVAAGESSYRFAVVYQSGTGDDDPINKETIDSDDVIVTRMWGPAEELAIELVGMTDDPSRSGDVIATYQFTPPGGSWDFLDFGRYDFSIREGAVTSVANKPVRAESLGAMQVRIDDPNVLYVTTASDTIADGSLRSAIAKANAKGGAPTTILLDANEYVLSQRPVANMDLVVPGLFAGGNTTRSTVRSSDNATGDLNITGNVTIIGDTAENTIIDAASIDRVFKVHQGASLSLQRISVARGNSGADQFGGGILSFGTLSIDSVIVRDNRAVGETVNAGGGGIAVLDGSATILNSRLTNNIADAGGGIYFANQASGAILGSTIDTNNATDFGGAVASIASGPVEIVNSTFSANEAPDGAAVVNRTGSTIERTLRTPRPAISGDGSMIALTAVTSNHSKQSGTRVLVFDSSDTGFGSSDLFGPLVQMPVEYHGNLSNDGRYLVFDTSASLVPEDTDDKMDVYVYDRVNRGNPILVSQTSSGVKGNLDSTRPSISDDGRFIVFQSNADNFVSNDNNGRSDVYLWDRETREISLISGNGQGAVGNGRSIEPVISGDGQTIAYVTSASNLSPQKTVGGDQVLLYRRQTGQTLLVSKNASGEQGNNFSHQISVSDDGSKVAFSSYATNLMPQASAPRAQPGVFVFDTTSEELQQLNLVHDDPTRQRGANNPTISGDGRFVVFHSRQSDLVANDDNDQSDIFFRDLVAGTTVRINDFTAEEKRKYDAVEPAISKNGDIVTFHMRPRSAADPAKIIRLRRSPTTEVSYDREDLPFNLGAETSLLHTTMIDNAGRAVVLGDVTVTNSIVLAGDSIAVDSGAELIGRNLFSANPYGPLGSSGNDQTVGDINRQAKANAANFLSPLTLVSGVAPVHLLKNGSTALNDATGSLLTDQLGRERDNPDLGAVEATGFSLSGVVYVDRNGNGRQDAGEFGQSGVLVYLDYNNNGVLDPGEQFTYSATDDPRTSAREDGTYSFFNTDGRNDVTVRVQLDPGFSQSEIPLHLVGQKGSSLSLTNDGRYVAYQSVFNIDSPDQFESQIAIYVYDRLLGTNDRVTPSLAVAVGSVNPSISGDGRYVAFESTSSTLVKRQGTDVDINRPYTPIGETVRTSHGFDVFIHDRITKTTEIASVDSVGNQRPRTDSQGPSLSSDGRYLAFYSTAILADGASPNAIEHVYLRDLEAGKTILVSFDDPQITNNNYNISPSVGPSGENVVFVSQLRSDITNPDSVVSSDIYLFNHNNGDPVIKLISRDAFGTPSRQINREPSFSLDGKFIVFTTDADNLDTGEGFSSREIVLYDIENDTLKVVSRQNAAPPDTLGELSGGYSSNAAVSADGRFVVFESSSNRLSLQDNSSNYDIYVFDRDAVDKTQQTKLLSINPNLPRSDESSLRPSISANGAWIGFDSEAFSLVENDFNASVDAFIVPNPFLVQPHGFAHQFTLADGDFVSGADFGIIAKPGSIRGRVYEDFLRNNQYDDGEAISQLTVYLDLNNNGVLDKTEPMTVTNADGMYEFLNLDANLTYRVAVIPPSGVEQIEPSKADDFVWTVFLPAGGSVSSRDFLFAPIASTGQTSSGDSTISGRLYLDTNGNKVFDQGDVVLANREVYLDLSNNGQRDHGDPVVTTNESGEYQFTNLSSGVFSVAMILEDGLEHVTPIGNDFSETVHDVFHKAGGKDEPRSIVMQDFDQDGFLDVAVLFSNLNQLSIRLNNRERADASGFTSDKIDIQLASLGTYPTSMVVGQFDTDPRLDVAIVANTTGNVIILKNFDPARNDFDAKLSIAVNPGPIDIVAGDFTGRDDGILDLVVLSTGSSSKAEQTIQVLSNDGQGNFSEQSSVKLGSSRAVAIVTGSFNDDEFLDVAVIQADNTTPQSPGSVVILSGDHFGALVDTQQHYLVGLGPVDAVVADFNGDGKDDIAVANLQSNFISLIISNEQGGFTVQQERLGVVAGLTDIVAADIDNDGDMDIVTSSYGGRSVSIFRNVSEAADLVKFEPLDSSGTTELRPQMRMPLAVGNFDNDRSGPMGTGTIDILAVPRPITNQRNMVVQIFKNNLVNGSRRVELTGRADSRSVDQDFIIGAATPNSIIPQALGEEILKADTPENMIRDLGLIDTRGFGRNRIHLDATFLAQNLSTGSLLIRADEEDEIVSNDKWVFDAIALTGGEYQRAFRNGDILVHSVSPNLWTNPFNAFDVDGDGFTTSLDALIIINELGTNAFSSNNERLLDPSRVDLARFKFVDPNKSGTVSPLDALQVINFLQSRIAAPMGKQVISVAVASFINESAFTEMTTIPLSTNSLMSDREISTIVTESRVAKTAHHGTLTNEQAPKAVPPKPLKGEHPESPQRVQALDETLEHTSDWLTL